MAKALPCRHCGHGRTKHTRQNNGEVTRCKYRYAARDGSNLHVGPDTDEKGHWKRDACGSYPRHYQCMCHKWEPEEIWRYDEETDIMILKGYVGDYERDGSKPSFRLVEE